MARRKPPNKTRPDAVPGEDELGRVYHAGGHELPPIALDARVLAAARAAVRPNRPRWAVPLSTAAVVVLSIGVVVLMTEQGALDRDREWTVPSEYSVPPVASVSPPTAVPEEKIKSTPRQIPEAVERREARTMPEPSKAKRALPASVPPAAKPDASFSATPVVAEESKKAVAPKAEAPARPPALAKQSELLGRAAETDRLGDTRDDATRTRSNQARPNVAGVLSMNTSTAAITDVQVSGSPGAYEFSVTVKSPDTGCQQYADWWEVVSADEKLLYRRVLLHSHVGEQPFTRSGGPVPIQPDTVVWVRGHMNNGGYGGVALKGSVKAGFKQAVPDAEFAAGLAKQAPLSDGCDF